MASARLWVFLGVAALLFLLLRGGRGGTHGDLKVSGRGNSEAIETIAHGERVDLADVIAPTGKTVIEFTADW
ncbi:MAG: hypothetical protein U1E76_17355 [Planctomycetota bacterium]